MNNSSYLIGGGSNNAASPDHLHHSNMFHQQQHYMMQSQPQQQQQSFPGYNFLKPNVNTAEPISGQHNYLSTYNYTTTNTNLFYTNNPYNIYASHGYQQSGSYESPAPDTLVNQDFQHQAKNFFSNHLTTQSELSVASNAASQYQPQRTSSSSPTSSTSSSTTSSLINQTYSKPGVEYLLGANQNTSNNNGCNSSNSSANCVEDTSALEENDLDSSENGKPPVIYAWMKKVHINNTGKPVGISGNLFDSKLFFLQQ